MSLLEKKYLLAGQSLLFFTEEEIVRAEVIAVRRLKSIQHSGNEIRHII